MPPVGFEPTVSAGEQPQTYALDRAATGTGFKQYIQYNINVHSERIKRDSCNYWKTEQIFMLLCNYSFSLNYSFWALAASWRCNRYWRIPLNVDILIPLGKCRVIFNCAKQIQCCFSYGLTMLLWLNAAAAAEVSWSTCGVASVLWSVQIGEIKVMRVTGVIKEVMLFVSLSVA